MTELRKFQRVNNCETIEELQQCILDFADIAGLIQGKTTTFDAKRMAIGALNYYQDPSGAVSPNIVTRMFGLRQQAMYLKHYKPRV